MRLQQLGHARRGRHGQIMVIFALVAVGLVGTAALGIDVFYIYWNKNQLQGGTDAAALAGATYFNNVTFTGKNGACLYATDAQNAACTYALNDGVLASELTSVVANSSNQSMTVSASRRVPALLAKVVGIQNFTVSATSVAVLQGLVSASNLAPIGLDSTTLYTYGQSIMLHNGLCGPGWWDGLSLMSASGKSTGGAVFRQNLGSGCACTVRGRRYFKRRAGCYGRPDRPGRKRSGDRGHCFGSQGDLVLAHFERRTGGGCSGGQLERLQGQLFPVTGFAEIWISGTSGADINAVFIRQVAGGTPGTGGTNMGAVHAQLTQ
jgi:Flp pilus assembly protein TadG